MSGSEANSPLAPVTIRRAELRDFPALVQLLRRYFVEGEVQHADSPETTREQLEAGPLGFVVAEMAGELAGCMLIRELNSVPQAVEGKRMYVAPEFRGHGIAGRLLNAVESLGSAAGYDWLYLDSKDKFAIAISMYRRRGFEDCERFHSCAEATVFLRKRL